MYALLKKLGLRVWLGAAFGALLAIANFAIMSLGAAKATRSAAGEGDVKGGQTARRLSYILRYLVMFGLLALLAKLNVIDPVAAVIPLVFMPPVIILSVYLPGKGGGK